MTVAMMAHSIDKLHLFSNKIKKVKLKMWYSNLDLRGLLRFLKKLMRVNLMIWIAT